MREEILLNIDNPSQLERLYRDNKLTFKSAFNALYPQLHDHMLAEGWNQRLNYSQDDFLWGSPGERTFIGGALVAAAFLAKLPAMLPIDESFYFTRNAGFIVFPLLIAFFAWKNKISAKTAAILASIMLASGLFINYLPENTASDTLVLSCLHLPLLLWCLLGFTFSKGSLGEERNWLGFIRYNGDLAVMAAVLVLAGGLTTALTINLFRITGWDIQEFYFNNIVICGLAALPLVATFLTQAQPAIVSKIAPVIARLFSPIALVMLLVYLVSVAFSGKNPYNDRDFLLVFNLLLAGVMALIFFSVAEAGHSEKNFGQVLILFLLAAVTLVVNGIALSAVLFRIAEWGITPNRAAVLGANAIMLVHLLYIGIRLFRVLKQKNDLSVVGRSLTFFLPVYGAWVAIVTFCFPVLFGFK